MGSKLSVTGQGFPPNANLVLNWATTKASWVVSGNPPQVTATQNTPMQDKVADVRANASGAFAVTITAPVDYGGKHFVQAFVNGTAIPGQGIFILEPSFTVSPASGPAGTPITVKAQGLGTSLYAASYHLSWDNSYVGYMTALTTEGSTNFTIYASGTPGMHYIDIYQGYPGPGYLNPQQGPPASETQSWFPPLIPFHTTFTVTSSQSANSGGSDIPGSMGVVYLVAAIAALMTGGFFLSRKDTERREAVTRVLVVVGIIALLAVAGIGFFLISSQGPAGATSNTSQVSFTPQASVIRPHIVVPLLHNATTGPRVSISPTTVGVGDVITVNGAGFAPGTQLPLTWATRQGSNLNGYQLVAKPLRNVTAGNDGSFSFNMKVPPDLGGLHFISAGNLTRNSNGTVFLQRTASISATQGQQGTNIVVTFFGVGWDYNTNIVAVDYDNSYVGYACGFNSGGNVSVTIVASGAPGVHTIDIYPSVWWGPSGPTSQQLVEYRYPLLTPQDHPELMPSFHFSYLITSAASTNATQNASAISGLTNANAPLNLGGIVFGSTLFTSQAVSLPRKMPSKPRSTGLAKHDE